MQSNLSPVAIGANTGSHAPLGMGCSFYGVSDWEGQQGSDILLAMQVALENGITHFDTAEGYGKGESERLIGRFLREDGSRRERMLIASKANLNDLTVDAMLKAIDGSRDRLGVDVIDLYYIHWPRTGKDLRPIAEGLERARQQGKIRAIGVSNFSVAQMSQVAEVATIDAHQLGYNLLWRFPERDIIPYCVENNIAVVVYSALAHGILSGKYQRELAFRQGDQRWTILHFREDVWSAIYEDVEQMKILAHESGQSLVHLALRWLLNQSGVTSVLVSAKNRAQALSNIRALSADVDGTTLAELTRLSDLAMTRIPDEGNPFGYHP